MFVLVAIGAILAGKSCVYLFDGKGGDYFFIGHGCLRESATDFTGAWLKIKTITHVPQEN